MEVKGRETGRRTQAERSAATKQAIIGAARPLFAEHGFAAVGTEAIVREAGVTRGALYHHFADKAELFQAVLETIEAELSTMIGETVTASSEADFVVLMDVGAQAWLDAFADPEIQRIVLIDAPAVLGWERWREIGMRHFFGLVECLLADAMAAGHIAEQPVRPLAHLLAGALDEATLYVAQSPDAGAARAEMGAAVSRLMASLAGYRESDAGTSRPP